VSGDVDTNVTDETGEAQVEQTPQVESLPPVEAETEGSSVPEGNAPVAEPTPVDGFENEGGALPEQPQIPEVPAEPAVETEPVDTEVPSEETYPEGAHTDISVDESGHVVPVAPEPEEVVPSELPVEEEPGYTGEERLPITPQESEVPADDEVKGSHRDWETY
jgi:hypothetical protein